MKSLLLICLFLTISNIAYSQKIIGDNQEIRELKNEVIKYTKVTILIIGYKWLVSADIDKGGIWNFYDETEQKPFKFKSSIHVLNYMYSNGWILKQQLDTGNNSSYQYLFEKKE